MLSAALALIGFTAVVAQTVFLRELLVVLQGNEITIALALAAWLAWTALGSGWAGRTRAANPWRRLILLETLSGLALPATVFGIRSMRAAIHLLPGESLGPLAALAGAVATLGVFCILSGALFAAGGQAWAASSGAQAGAAVGRVYVLEAMGALAGGLLAGLFLAGRFDSMEIAVLGAVCNILTAAALLVRCRKLALAAAVAALAVVLPAGAPWLTRTSLSQLWHGVPLIASENTPYANLAVVGAADHPTLYENGLIAATAADTSSAEESVHFALLQHAEPKTLLMIGGAVSGAVAEALKHASLERIDCVELDPAMLAVASRYFPTKTDARVTQHFADARLWLKTNTRRFDAIIVNLPDPQTAQINRYYTLEFFREAARHLTPSGVFSFRLTGGENYVSPRRGAFLGSINRTLRQAFLQVMAYPGANVHFFAANRRAPLVADPRRLVARLKARALVTQYVNEFDIPFRLTEDRVLQLGLAIRPQATTPLNRDFAPVAYYFNAILWSAQFGGRAADALEALARVRFPALAIMMGALSTLIAFLVIRRGDARRGVAAYSTAVMGFTMMSLEVLLLLGYQAIYGVLYRQLAVVIGAFMGGMALGSWRGLRMTRGHERALARLGWLAVGSAIALVASMMLLGRGTDSIGSFVSSHLLIPALGALAGLLGGWQFPVASRVYYAREHAGTGALYAWDLVGACAGALLIGVWLVPVHGFLKTAILVAVAGLPAALAACWWARHPATAAGAIRQTTP